MQLNFARFEPNLIFFVNIFKTKTILSSIQILINKFETLSISYQNLIIDFPILLKSIMLLFRYNLTFYNFTFVLLF